MIYIADCDIQGIEGDPFRTLVVPGSGSLIYIL